MNYKLAMAIVAELQALMLLLESPEARWNTLQDWLARNPRWGKPVKRYVKVTPAEALADLKAFLIAETEIPEAIVSLAITPEIEARAKISIERLQTLYKLRKAQEREIEA